MRPALTIRFLAFGIIVSLSGTMKAQDAAIDFAEDVAPILREKCVGCHDRSLQMAGLRMDTREAMVDAGVLVPGDADASLLLQRLHDKGLGILMPPTGRLSAADQETLKRWVDSGAAWPSDTALQASQDDASVDDRTAALMKFIRLNDLSATREMLKDESLANRTGRHGTTPLMQAALYARPELVALLMERGAEVNATDENGMTPLMMAVGDPRKVALLLKHGADAKAKSKLGRPVLVMAASFAGNLRAVKALIKAGADVNAADGRRWSPLIMAARTGDRQLVRTLLDAGADVGGGSPAKFRPGSPLMQAAWASDVKLAQMLIERGADQDQTSLDAALIYAATHGSAPLVNLLLAAGASPKAKFVTNYVPESPILAAAYSDRLNVDIVETLLGRGVDVNVKDERGLTPLEIARDRGETKIVALISAAGTTGAEPAGGAGESKPEERERIEAAKPKPVDQASAREVTQKAISLLQSSGPTFFAKSGCTACHQQTASMLVTEMGREKGFEIDDQTRRQQRKLLAADLQRQRVGFLQRMKSGGASHRLAYLLWGLAASGYEADEVTDATYIELAGLQRRDGSWVSDAHRPPTEYSPVTATAVSIQALQAFAPPGFEQRNRKRIERATTWLVKADAPANAEKAFRLLGMRWGDANRGKIDQAVSQLLETQVENGGWSQLPDLPPDAYATGLTLYALHQAGDVPTSHPAYQKGIEFLLRSCGDDGSWHVPSRSFKFQPYFESGFPYEHDQWISAAATGWAAMALMQSVETDGS